MLIKWFYAATSSFPLWFSGRKDDLWVLGLTSSTSTISIPRAALLTFFYSSCDARYCCWAATWPLVCCCGNCTWMTTLPSGATGPPFYIYSCCKSIWFLAFRLFSCSSLMRPHPVVSWACGYAKPDHLDELYISLVPNSVKPCLGELADWSIICFWFVYCAFIGITLKSIYTYFALEFNY